MLDAVKPTLPFQPTCFGTIACPAYDTPHTGQPELSCRQLIKFSSNPTAPGFPTTNPKLSKLTLYKYIQDLYLSQEEGISSTQKAIFFDTLICLKSST